MKIKDIYDVKRSAKSIGQLYPVLLDAKGKKIIDGLHRLQADQNWHQIRLNHIRNEKDIIAARIIANVCRREVSPYEKSQMFNHLAQILINEGISRRHITKTVSNITGASYRTASRYLSKKFKDHSMVRKADKIVANLATINFSEVDGFREAKHHLKEIKFFGVGDNRLITVIRSSFKPKEETDYHWHSSNFYWFCLKGEGIYRIKDEEYPIKNDTLVYCGKHTPHQIINMGNDELEALTLYFPPLKLENYLLEDKVQPEVKKNIIQKLTDIEKDPNYQA